MGFADSYAVAFAGRLASGMGGTLFNLVLTKMATDWFARREIVLAMAVILSTWPFGNALGLLTEPRIAEAFGWRAVMLFAGGLCLLSWLLIALFYRVPPGEEPATNVSAQPFGLPPWRVLASVLVTGVMWGSFNAGFVAYFSFVPAFLTSRQGMTMTDAGATASLALWVGMVSIPFCGFIAQRIGRSSVVIVLFCTLAAASLAALVAGAPPFLACVLFGLAIGPPPGVITSLPSRILQPDERAGGFGVFYTCHFLLQASGPAIGGWILDLSGAGAAVAFGAALFLVPLPLLGWFRFLTGRLDGIVPLAHKRRG